MQPHVEGFRALLVRLVLMVLSVTGLVLNPTIGDAASGEQGFETITYTAPTTLRDFVGRHLGDPDLWPYVLKLNQIADLADLRFDDTLKMPVKQVRAADEALRTSLTAIQNAIAEGAQVFAALEIGKAIASRESALEHRDGYQWAQVVDLSDIATLLAHEALEIAIAQRDRSAEAVVSDVQGDVQGRTPADPRWSGRGRNDILVEFERVRTLSDSTTQIMFRDLSRLRLNANSNATIQRMRSDPLTGDEVTKVSLVSGDFYAVLNQLSDRTAFEIDVPGIETRTSSSDFWVKNDVNSARFVNYDNADLQVTRGDTDIVLGENEGVVLGRNGAQISDVLEGPLLRQPGLDVVIYTAEARLGWDVSKDAAAYWLEVSRDAGFNAMQISEWGIPEATHIAEGLPPARYFWRVAALDALGLPGQWSKPSSFTMRQDTTQPFLTLLSPGNDTLTEQPSVIVFGAAESDANVLLNGQSVALQQDGSFELVLPLVPGENPMLLEATDPAGNVTLITQTVTYRPAVAVEITFDPTLPIVEGAIATRSEELSVRAQTTAAPNAPVSVLDNTGATVVQTLVGPDGALTFSVPVADQAQGYRIEVFAPGGKIEGATDFLALRDTQPPGIELDMPLPRATDNPAQQIAGRVDGAVSLSLNGQPVMLTDGRFAIDLTLAADINEFDLVATDGVGNVTAKRLKTVYDIDPPVITQAKVTRPQGEGGPIQITVAASDPSGLRKSATYLIAIGGVEQDGFLRCDPATGICKASLPPEPGKIQLIEVAIEDYAGNTAFN